MGAVANGLVPCTDCGGAVSRRAITCPNCGREIRLGPWSLVTRGAKTSLRLFLVYGVAVPVLVLAVILAVMYAGDVR